MSDTNASTQNPEYSAALQRAIGTVSAWMKHLVDPDQVVELRALRVQDGSKDASNWAGTYRGHEELTLLVEQALKLSGLCSGVYYTINPLRPERYRQQTPRTRKAARGDAADDADVVERRWMVVDIDPLKPVKHKDDSSTDAEKGKTLELAGIVREYLAAEGVGQPIVCDSGNGHHLLYRLANPLPVDRARLPLPEDDQVRLALIHLAEKFNGERGLIDTKMYNPSRIVKFPGTLACKGNPTDDRPHRRAKVIEIPGG